MERMDNNYVTENTFDAYLMNIIVTKQRFISQLMSGKAAARKVRRFAYLFTYGRESVHVEINDRARYF